MVFMTHEWHQGEYTISTDRSRIDLQVVHAFLTTSYWAKGIPMETVKRSIEHSLNFGLYKGDQQIGFARIISDLTTFAYLGDVFILDSFRGQGLSKWLMEVIVNHPDLQGLRRWSLATRDAHGLYRQFGFTELSHPEFMMQRHFPNVYVQSNEVPSTN